MTDFTYDIQATQAGSYHEPGRFDVYRMPTTSDDPEDAERFLSDLTLVEAVEWLRAHEVRVVGVTDPDGIRPDYWVEVGA